jgi:hypothetical protein
MKLNSAIAAFCWIIVFPGFIIYQTAVQLAMIPPALGGYYTASIGFALFILIYPYLDKWPIKQSLWIVVWRKHIRLDILFWMYVCLMLMATLLGITREVDSAITDPLLAYIFKFIGLYVLASLTPWENLKFLKLVQLIHILICILLITNASEGAYLANLVLLDDREQDLDYHGLALAFSVISLTAGHWTASIPWRWIQWQLSLTGLFLIGARSEFVGTCIAILVIEFSRRKKFAECMALALIPICVVAAFYLLAYTMENESRVFGLLNLAIDESSTIRKELSLDAWATIIKNPISGAFASYEPGHYAHNILSAWVDLGLIGFIVLCLLVTLPISSILFGRKSAASSTYRHLVLGCLMMCITMLIFAKTYFYQMIPIVLGMYARLLWSEFESVHERGKIT